MFRGSLRELATVVQGVPYGADVTCCGVSTDTRELPSGALFGAIQGPRFDGHLFIDSAVKAGAVAALVQRPLDCDLPHVVVDCVVDALLRLAAYWRLQQSLVAVAVTGSCGKTTTRQILQSVFSAAGKTLASSKSFNNHIGVPYTLLQLSSEYQYYIQEIGANHIGEITPLVAAVKPNIAIITNSAAAHLEGFGNIAGVAQAKGEILAGLQDDGVAIVNRDDDYYSFWCGLLGKRHRLSFSMVGHADVMARNIILDKQGRPSFILICPAGEVAVSLQLIGMHNVSNALAAAAAACAAGLSLSTIQEGLQSAEGEQHRLQRHVGIAGAVVIDDSYNANPLSVSSAIELLSHQEGETFLVLGDMLELGECSKELHCEVGKKAINSGINHILCYGHESRATAQACGGRGCHFDEQDALVSALKPQLHEGAAVLVKGSLSMNMRQIVTKLLASSTG